MKPLWDTIDLNKHGVIEAHAGTGKTFTIVNMVLRIIETAASDTTGKVRLVHIREILVVTFTEKAAGELKKRIRDGLEERIASSSIAVEIKTHLENCLNNLHEALIGTIHAISLRLLQTWPFESGIPFDTEITDDTDGLVSALRESMRIDWQDESTTIPWALGRMAARGERIEEPAYGLLCKIAKELLDEDYVQLDRTAVNGWNLGSIKDRFDEISAQLANSQTEFMSSLHRLIDALQKAYDAGAIPAGKTALFENRIAELREMAQGKNSSAGIIQDPCKCGTSTIYTQKDLKSNRILETVEAYRTEIKGHPFTMAQLQMESIAGKILLTLVCDAAELLALRWKRTKREKGFISYQDMLHLMYRAVTERPSFTAALRAKLSYAIIDEFQDTSRLQWEVFNALFLTDCPAASPRLFLVGDPKQSIYAFQGADVYSYLDARTAIFGHGGAHYALEHNFRSLASTIHGYNSVFLENAKKESWFKFDHHEQSITYPEDNAVTPPDRILQPSFPLLLPPVQVVALSGSSGERKAAFAEYACRSIEKLTGTTLSVPAGLHWREITLDYEHFAVIVETHKVAEVFLEAFREAGIPAVKYKMEGVFQSPMARALHAILEAVRSPFGDPAPRRAALLTHFFNRSPQSIDPERDLEPCFGSGCSKDTLCIAHALEEWTVLAEGAYWAQLFERIQQRTGIHERLIRLRDGERHRADLQQIIDYCIELLYCRKFTLGMLTDHLGSMLDEVASAGQDRNLHVLETQKSSVKVLTMHAAKGLEFPVVFAATGSSKTTWKGPGFVRFTGGGSAQTGSGRIINIAPYFSNREIRTVAEGIPPEAVFLEQAVQERRRLLYVALTRAQAMLFVPLQLEEIRKNSDGSMDWSACKLPSKGVDDDLTPKLIELLKAAAADSPIALFDLKKFPAREHRTPVSTTGKLPDRAVEPVPEISSLKLPARICRQTSYSQLSRETASSREIDRSDEPDGNEEEMVASEFPSPLPGGKQTGDALHCAIEEILKRKDAADAVHDEGVLKSCIEKYLKRNGILAQITQNKQRDESAIDNAVAAGMNCVRGALSAQLRLPDSPMLVAITGLSSADYRVEMEFLLTIGQQWLHGYMDMVFRLPNLAGGVHPWRYFVLDWKSDSVAVFDEATIGRCIKMRHYDLQAQLYCHALDRYLSGVLGSAYHAAEHLGGAVYVFLREHEKTPQAAATVWTHRASPEKDKQFTFDLVAARSM